MITITSDFECGNAKNVQHIEDNRYRLEVVGDEPVWCYYFCFDIKNDGPQTHATVEVWHDPVINDPQGFIANFPTTIWIQSSGAPHYKPLEQQQVEYHGDHIVIHILLAENQTVRVTNLWPAPYSETCEFVQHLADERNDRCELFTLGKSVQGRDILGIRAGTPGKPQVLCIAGQHPTETSGIWGMRGIADFITSLLPDAATLREELLVEVIPLVNPDGNVAGRNAFNAEGHNMWLAFRDDPDASEPEAHENKLLWRKATEQGIALWMNIHCYKGWRESSEHPYDGWHEVPRDLFQDPDQARLYQALCDTMRLETTGLSSSGTTGSTHPKSTMCYQLAKRLGIPAIFYEMNAGTAGPYRATRDSVDVFKKGMHTLLHHM